MGAVTVRVVPRAGRTSVEVSEDAVVVRVRSAPERGRATEEARRALAESLGVPATRIRLRTGARSRTKVFDIEGLNEEEARMRLRAT